MRAALPLKPANARAERAEERARANALQAQIDELNAEMVVARAEAERALAEERQRADRLNGQVEALSAEVVRAEKRAEAAADRAERAEAGRDAERARAEAQRTTMSSGRAGALWRGSAPSGGGNSVCRPPTNLLGVLRRAAAAASHAARLLDAAAWRGSENRAMGGGAE